MLHLFLQNLLKMFGKVTKKDFTQNMQQYFNALRPLFPSLSKKQEAGIILLTNATRHLPLEQRAYLLATAYHETAHTMEPVTEFGGVRYFDKYDVGRLAAALGNTPEKDGDGYFFRGRGYVQITGRANYEKAGKKLKLDLLNKPSLALEPRISAEILIAGCTEGWFTGKRLDKYINKEKKDYRNARRVVNGLDRANDIAKYAEVFEQALKTI